MSRIYPHYLTTVSSAGASVVATCKLPANQRIGNSELLPGEWKHYFQECVRRLLGA